MPDPGRIADALALGTSRRGFLSRVGKALVATAGAGVAAAALEADEADAFHICGHTYTTGSCPHPTGIPRIDAHGYPLRASDGHRVDDLGRPIDGHGYPVDAAGRRLLDPDGRPLPRAPRTRVCQAAGHRYGFHAESEGSWYRCCGGHVRKLWDCCAFHGTRING